MSEEQYAKTAMRIFHPGDKLPQEGVYLLIDEVQNTFSVQNPNPTKLFDLVKPTEIQETIERTVTNGMGYNDHRPMRTNHSDYQTLKFLLRKQAEREQK